MKRSRASSESPNASGCSEKPTEEDNMLVTKWALLLCALVMFLGTMGCRPLGQADHDHGQRDGRVDQPAWLPSPSAFRPCGRQQVHSGGGHRGLRPQPSRIRDLRARAAGREPTGPATACRCRTGVPVHGQRQDFYDPPPSPRSNSEDVSRQITDEALMGSSRRTLDPAKTGDKYSSKLPLDGFIDAYGPRCRALVREEFSRAARSEGRGHGSVGPTDRQPEAERVLAMPMREH